jgi:hypothetical protein
MSPDPQNLDFFLAIKIEKVRFAVDSLVEGEGFEPSVPRQKDNAFRDSPVQFGNSPSARKTGSLRDRDHRFESLSAMPPKTWREAPQAL